MDRGTTFARWGRKRRSLADLAFVLGTVLAVVVGIGLLVLHEQPGGIRSLVGRFGGMSTDESRYEALVESARERALEHVVLQLDREPGLGRRTWWDTRAPWGHVPELTLFDDGTVVYLKTLGIAEFPVPMEARLDGPTAQGLVDEVVALGFDRLRSQESTSVPSADGVLVGMYDAGYVRLFLRREGRPVSLRIYDWPEATSDRQAYESVVGYLESWAAADASPLVAASSVLYWEDEEDLARMAPPIDLTPYEHAAIDAVGRSGGSSEPLDLDTASWPVGVPVPTRFPAVVASEDVSAIAAARPLQAPDPQAANDGTEPDRRPPAPVTDYPAPAAGLAMPVPTWSPGAEGVVPEDEAGWQSLALASSFWAWPFTIWSEDGSSRVGRLVCIPWVYGGRYDPSADVAAAAEMVARAEADDRATEAALTVRLLANADRASTEAAAAEVPTIDPHPDAPFPPVSRPAPLPFDLGLQVWSHWMDTPERVLAPRREVAPTVGWLKQRFAWKDVAPLGPAELAESGYTWHIDDWIRWARWRGGGDLQYPPGIIVQLDVPPDWARTDGDDPFDLEAWGRFVHDFAGRARGSVDAYEILNEPNLAREFGSEPNPEAYARILATAFRAVKTADPDATVISAGLAPTGTDLPQAMGDDEFLRRLYAAMEGAGGSDLHFDALGAHAPGFLAEPSASPGDVEADPSLGGRRYFAFRRVEDLREIMALHGDEDKQVVVTEFGFTTDPRPDSPYHWFAVSEAERARRIRDAYLFARDNWAPWVGPLVLFSAADPAWTEADEAYWWSVTGEDGGLRPEIREAFADLR